MDEQLAAFYQPERKAEEVKWLPAKEAAERMGVSVRTALDYLSRVPGGGAPIRGRDEIAKGTNRVRKLLHAGDIERVIYERENGIKSSSEASEPRTPRAIAAPAITVQMPAPEALPLFLTLDQAIAYSGLPRVTLLQLIANIFREAGAPYGVGALDVGPRPGGRWRISRAALDKFAAS